MTPQRLAVSLFTGAGIGDVGFRAAGYEFIVMAELDPPRAGLAEINFPTAKMVTGDLWSTGSQVVEIARAHMLGSDAELDLITCTAPCQGMSKNGQGTLLRNIRAGKRPKLDPRNRLILPALQIMLDLKPKWIVFENVSEMASTLIEDSAGAIRPILDIVQDTLGPEYAGRAYDVEMADFGIPQRRRRLITVYSRLTEAKEHLEMGGKFVPAPTHALRPTGSLLQWESVTEAIGGFPPLDAGEKSTATSDLPFHRVPLLDERKYEWVKNAAPGSSAFDNQCVACGYEENATHGSAVNKRGVNRAKTDTPIRCSRCEALLPRPHVIGDDGQPRLMKGYTSAYKRMAADLPAPALTRNLSYACSDQKLHPTQNRVLSLAEAFKVHTLSDYDYSWTYPGGVSAKDGVIRLALGESIPPRFIEKLGCHLIAVEDGDAEGAVDGEQLQLK